jgi:hypothetical protein
MKAMKAYVCGGDLGECVDLIYAETASKARYYSYCLQEASCDFDLTEIRVKRCPQADKFVDPDKDSSYHVHLPAEQWREIGGKDYGEDWGCISCGLSPLYDWWPESERSDTWNLCEDCSNCGECGCDCDTKGDQDENS